MLLLIIKLRIYVNLFSINKFQKFEIKYKSIDLLHKLY